MLYQDILYQACDVEVWDVAFVADKLGSHHNVDNEKCGLIQHN